MSAPHGNQFWKQRSKHGNDLIFSSPVIMWEAACEYFEWCDSNPFIEVAFMGKNITQVKIPRMRPYTLDGLCTFLNVASSYFREFKRTTLPKQENAEDFLSVITRIEAIIRNQKFSGAAAGFFNANIIARDLGLVDKQQLGGDAENPIVTNNTHTVVFKDMTKDE